MAKRRHDQGHSNARAVNLHPRDREQKMKRRPILPVGARMAALLDAADDFYVSVDPVDRVSERAVAALLRSFDEGRGA